MTNEENIHHYHNSLDTRVALVEMAIVNISKTHDELKNHNLRIENELKEIRKEMKSDSRWLLSVIIAAFTGLAGIMAHGFHWF